MRISNQHYDRERLAEQLRHSFTEGVNSHRERAAATGKGGDPSGYQSARVSQAADSLAGGARSIGNMPPSPPTFRGRLGASLVRLMQRALFWYTPQISSLFRLTAEGFSETAGALRAQHEEAARLREETTQLRNETSALGRELDRRLDLLDAKTTADMNKLVRDLESIRSEVAQLQAGMRRVEERGAATDTALIHANTTNESERAAYRGQIQRLEQRLSHASMNIAAQERRLSILIEAARRHEPGTEAFAAKGSDEAGHLWDGLYVAFEDVFRGTRSDIKNRVQPYLADLQAALAGTPERPVLDLGCGRGEWLEVLRENAMVARGIDSNRAMVGLCASRGLDAQEADAIAFLRRCNENSLGAVTGFHIVEHLPMETLMALLDETVRVLAPGGIAIFETPNPANVLVGSSTFYYDLTHRNPIPAPTLQFVAEARGLCHVEIKYLHPALEKFPENGWEGASRLNEYFFGPQDYAVIGRKAQA